MAGLVYASFDLLIERAGSAYRARVLDLPAGQSSAEFNLPFPIGQLDDVLAQLDASSSPADGLQERVQKLGQQLFEALFSGAVRDGLAASLDLTTRQAAACASACG